MATYNITIDRPSITLEVNADAEEEARNLAYNMYLKEYPYEPGYGWVAEADKIE